MSSTASFTHADARPDTDRSQRELRTVVGSSLIGTTIEFYDFFIYGTAAALVFPKLFFPNFSPLAGILAAYATLAIPFLTRPLGAIVLGLFISTLVFALLPKDTLLEGGWRIPFLATAVILIVGMVIRTRVHETPVFQQAHEKAPPPRTPILEVLRHHKKPVLLAMGM